MSAPSPAKPRKRTAKKTAAPKPPSPMEGAIRPPTVPVYSEDKITPISQWKSNTGIGQVIELPSGNFVKLRRTMNLTTLLSSGKIPNPLADIVRGMISTGKTEMNIGELDKDAAMQFAVLVHEQIQEIFIKPKVQARPDDWDDDEHGVWIPDADAMDINMLSFEDQMYAFTWAQGAATDLATFRTRAIESMATVQHGEGVEQDPSGVDRAES